jgi:uncharacterized membrane protein YdjX (TVP38/TMEM64 family)
VQRLLGWIVRQRGKIAILFVWVGGLVGLRLYMDANALTFDDISAQSQSHLSDYRYGPLLYILIYLLRPLAFFPGTLLTILGGSVFGMGWGFVLSLFGGVVSAVIPYVIGRWFSAEYADSDETKSRLQRFVGMLRQNPFQAVLIMRLIYLPYDAVNVLVGTLRIPFITFIAATLVGNLAGTLSFVSLGASMEGSLAAGDLSLNPTMLLVSVLVILLSLLVSQLLRRPLRKKDVSAA